jgi:CDP-diacylglycerol--glycerol-3-phosphate 3-phosphatidyltransferase
VTFATTLTLLRLVLIIPITVLTLDHKSSVAALLLFIIAAATDYFDGFVARRFGQVTDVGARLDASVDKVFVYALLGALAIRGSFLVVIVVAALSRDLFVEFCRQRAAAKSNLIPANCWGKAKFLLQCLSIGIALVAQDLPNASSWYVVANGVLAIAIAASIPGAIVVWNASRREVARPKFALEANRFRYGGRAAPTLPTQTALTRVWLAGTEDAPDEA